MFAAVARQRLGHHKAATLQLDRSIRLLHEAQSIAASEVREALSISEHFAPLLAAQRLLTGELLVDPHALALHEVPQGVVRYLGRRREDQVATTIHRDLKRAPAGAAPHLKSQV